MMCVNSGRHSCLPVTCGAPALAVWRKTPYEAHCALALGVAYVYMADFAGSPFSTVCSVVGRNGFMHLLLRIIIQPKKRK